MSKQIISYHIISCRLACYVHFVTSQLPLVAAPSLTTNGHFATTFQISPWASIAKVIVPPTPVWAGWGTHGSAKCKKDQRSPLCKLEYPPKISCRNFGIMEHTHKIHVLDSLVGGGMVTYNHLHARGSSSLGASIALCGGPQSQVGVL